MDEIENLFARWRHKAEELRTVADHTANPFAQASFRRMAETYDKLAEDFKRQAK